MQKKHIMMSLGMVLGLAACGSSSAEEESRRVHDGALYPLSVSSVEGAVKANFMVEIADEPQELAHGLMFRKDMPKNQGMIFIWEKPSRQHMWMKNTYIPLDMLFIQGERVLDMVSHAKPQSLDLLGGQVDADKVLELNAGTIAQYHIQIGDHVRLEEHLPAQN